MILPLALACVGLALAAPTEKRAIANYYSQADGQIVKNPTSTSGLTPLGLTLGTGGSLVDQNGRICYTVVATGQLQCSSPVITQPVTQTGFSSINGNLAQNGNTVFYECETVGGTAANFHLYNHNDGEICFSTTIPLTSGTAATSAAKSAAEVSTSTISAAKTVTITSTTLGKTSTITQTIPAVVRTITITSTATAKRISTVRPAGTTTAKLTSTVRPAGITTTKAVTSVPVATAPSSPNLYPRLIVPVIAGQGAQGTKYFISLTSTTKTDLLFDIAASSNYKTCTLVGRFPVGGNPTSSGAYGSAQVQAELLVSNISIGTSSANQPAGKADLGTKAAGTALVGATAVYTSFAVVAGQSYSISLTATSGSLTVFEDYNLPVTGYTLNCV